MKFVNSKAPRRILAFVLMGIMVFGMCAITGTASAEKQVIRWMVWGSPDGWNDKINILYETYPEYAEKYDIQVEVGGKSDGEVAQKLRLALSAGTDIPDIVQFNYSGMLGFAAMDVLYDLTASMASYADDLLGGAKQLIQYQGKTVAFPVFLKSKLWFYRKDMFDQAGIDPAQIVTEDDFIAAGHKLHEAFPDSYIWNIGPSIAGYDLGMVLSGNGASFCDTDGNYTVATDPGVRQAFAFFKRLLDEDIVLNVSDFTPDWEQAFANGSLASTLNASWFASKSYIPVYAPDQAGKWAVAQWPEVGGSVGGSDSGGSVSAIPAQAKNIDAAIDILQKITFDPTIREKIFASQGQLPLSKTLIDQELYNQPDPYFGATLPLERNISLGDRFKVFNYTPAASLEFTLMNQYLNIFLQGEMTLDEALQNAQQDLANQIGNPYQY